MSARVRILQRHIFTLNGLFGAASTNSVVREGINQALGGSKRYPDSVKGAEELVAFEEEGQLRFELFRESSRSTDELLKPDSQWSNRFIREAQERELAASTS